MAFMVLLSFFTGANPIESFFMLIWQVMLYVGGLIVFGTPVFLLVAFITMTWGEEKKEMYEDPVSEAKVVAKQERSQQPQKKRRPAPAPEQVSTAAEAPPQTAGNNEG